MLFPRGLQPDGDDFVLAYDPVQRYNLYEALKVGCVLDELGYAWFEDSIRSTDLEGLVELNCVLDLPLHIGEFLFSISDFAEYIKRGPVDVVRLIADVAASAAPCESECWPMRSTWNARRTTGKPDRCCGTLPS